jgi:hypothetical protein
LYAGAAARDMSGSGAGAAAMTAGSAVATAACRPVTTGTPAAPAELVVGAACRPVTTGTGAALAELVVGAASVPICSCGGFPWFDGLSSLRIASIGSSSTDAQNCESGSAGRQLGSGVQPAGGTHPAGTRGQPGGELNWTSVISLRSTRLSHRPRTPGPSLICSRARWYHCSSKIPRRRDTVPRPSTLVAAHTDPAVTGPRCHYNQPDLPPQGVACEARLQSALPLPRWGALISTSRLDGCPGRGLWHGGRTGQNSRPASAGGPRRP